MLKLPYNHTSPLTVDLQVGLWAQPLPMDWDGDGDLDMVAATSGAPSNGVWVYENVTGDASVTTGAEGKVVRRLTPKMVAVVADGTRLLTKSNDNTLTIGASAAPDVIFKQGKWVAKGLEDTVVSYVDGAPIVCVPGEAKVRAAGEATPFGGAVAGPSVGSKSAGTAGGDARPTTSLKDCFGVMYPDFRKSRFEKPVTIPVVQQRAFNRTRVDQWKFFDYDGDGAMDVVLGLGVWDDYGWDDAYNPAGVWTNGPLHGYVYVARNEGTTAAPKYGPLQQVMAGYTAADVRLQTRPGWKPGPPEKGQEKGPDLKPVDVYGAPSPNFADFDGDGDLDLVCGEFLDGLTYFENVGTRTAPKYARGRFLARDGAPIRMDLQMLQVIALDWDGDGRTDLVVGQEDGRIALVRNTGEVKDHMPVFESPRFFKQQADYLHVGVLPAPASVDWDGDGDDDLICGVTAGYLEFVENIGTRKGLPVWAPPVHLEAGGAVIRIQSGANGGIQGPAEAKWGYSVPAVGDWNGDGLPDIVINSITGEILWYENIGTKTAPKLAAAKPVEVEWDGPTPKPSWNWWQPKGKQLVTQWRASPYLGDMNGDGIADLVLLDQEGYLALFERAKKDDKLVTLAPKRVFLGEDGNPMRLNAERAGKSGRRKFTFCDWDGDGKLDLMLDGKNVDFWKNIGEKGEWKFKNMGPIAEQNLLGHTTDPAVVDWNKDGIPDIVIGAEDGCLYYCQNPRTKK